MGFVGVAAGFVGVAFGVGVADVVGLGLGVGVGVGVGVAATTSGEGTAAGELATTALATALPAGLIGLAIAEPEVGAPVLVAGEPTADVAPADDG